MDVNELPLQELFTRLREAGLPLGIDEYQSVLRAMQAGFGMADKAALKRLCQTLWVKSAEEKQLFEYSFERVMGNKAILLSSEELASKTGEYVAVASAEELASKTGEYIAVASSARRKFTQLVSYGILGCLSAIFVLGFIFTSQQRTPTDSQTPVVEQTETGTPKTNTNQSDWIFWILLSVIAVGGGGYVLFRWVSKSNEEQPIGESISLPEQTPTPLASALPPELTQTIKDNKEQPIGESISLPEQTPSPPASALPLELTQQTIKDEVQVAQAVLQATSRHEQISVNRFILNSEYFPVTERQMKQIWRYLRRPVREGAATEFDVEATVNQIGRNGILLEPVLVPRRVNRADLLLLIDQDGSMVPFHALSQRLTETAMRGGRLGGAGIYYFHNCPLDYLYHDPNHQEAELVSDIVTHVCSNRTAVLIFSDAGAARGGYNKERYELTKEFLAKLKQQVHYIAWLNPMPKKRWFSTTAGEIAHLVPMFELSRRGMQDTIGVLRGRPTNFEGRKK